MRRSLAAAAVVAALAAVLTACSPFSGGDGTSTPGRLPTPGTPRTHSAPYSLALRTTAGSAGISAPATVESAGGGAVPTGPQVVEFGVDDGLLFVEVQNRSQVRIRSARVLITAQDAHGTTIVSSTGVLGSRCCTVYGLPPGGKYGLFVSLRGSTDPVASVQVRYLDPVVVPERGRTATVTVQHPVLSTRPGDAVVRATLITHGDTGRYVVGQAFLVDRQSRLVGVISGRFYCFTPSRPRTVSMHLLHPVPKGTRVVAAVAYPVPPGRPTGVGYRCSS